jgi:allophanate hydrolase
MTVAGCPLEIGSLRNAFVSGAMSVEGLLDQVLGRIRQRDDPAIWISRTSESAVIARARRLDAKAAADPGVVERLPLFGIPCAVKDNIDVAGMPTTAGCPAFAYTPSKTAPVVARLLAAGAVLLGKTNLDQFATGLVGTRSPYGVPRNPFDARFIPGGSSSGSAVAVATGLISFALGTDTAGSGRIPAAFNNIVGLKPTRGLLSTRGTVPACRSLDCVSVLALTARDASAVFEVAACYDPDDPLARLPNFDPIPASRLHSNFRFGVPPQAELDFFGNEGFGALFEAAAGLLEKTGGTRVETGFVPFRDAGRLLYDGPWVAERLNATEDLLNKNPGAMLAITRSIIEGARRYSALDAYRGEYELAALRRSAEQAFAAIDVLLLPTAGTIYEIAEIAAEPVSLNSNLGLYTNFVNLLDLAAIALPVGFDERGLPFGVSLIAPAFRDRELLDLGARFEALTALPLGAALVGEGQSSATASSARTIGAG